MLSKKQAYSQLGIKQVVLAYLNYFGGNLLSNRFHHIFVYKLFAIKDNT